MAKKIWRWWRGELNGHYILALLKCPNVPFDDELAEVFEYAGNVQWLLEGEESGNEEYMSEDDMRGIMQVGGLFPLATTQLVNFGSLRWTPSKIYQNQQRSTRGLFSMNYEGFFFYRLEKDDYDDDINTLADENNRSSMIEAGAELLGYVAEGTSAFDEFGEIIQENILSSPPTDMAYTEFYGIKTSEGVFKAKYLTTERWWWKTIHLPIKLLKLLFEALQYIRFNGASIDTMMSITSSLCDDEGDKFIYDIEITQVDYHYLLKYSLDTEAKVEYKEGRMKIWKQVMKWKFPTVVLEYREE